MRSVLPDPWNALCEWSKDYHGDRRWVPPVEIEGIWYISARPDGPCNEITQVECIGKSPRVAATALCAALKLSGFEQLELSIVHEGRRIQQLEAFKC